MAPDESGGVAGRPDSGLAPAASGSAGGGRASWDLFKHLHAPPGAFSFSPSQGRVPRRFPWKDQHALMVGEASGWKDIEDPLLKSLGSVPAGLLVLSR